MKTAVKFFLQTLLGFDHYLYFFSRYKIRNLHHDRKEGDFFHFMTLLPENGTLLDIGANIGIMTVHLARLPGSNVIAFEPMPRNLHALRRIITHYRLHNVMVMDCALGNEDGFVEMVMPMVGTVRMQGLSHVLHESIAENNSGETVKVVVRRLDNLPEVAAAKTITGIKMDVENFEYFVLEGGRELIRKHKPVLYIELWDNQNRQHCFSLLQQLDYGVYVVEKDQLVKFEKQNKQNFIFLPLDYAIRSDGNMVRPTSGSSS
jgi:FkbM family methyltransferase